MKNIYIGEMVNGNYLYSDRDLFDPLKRKEFSDRDGLIAYLSGADMEKIRKRNNLVVKSGLEDNVWLREALKKAGFKSSNIESI